ncbi:type II toxin-antitoxin system Phd/YefM family antitoxin [Ottowia testudinis]|uniref:Antitoxin n=1 Tax=Ottowia testudinis TaxID=2816950 RepID=A0A975CGN3_9BURK|nr:type II toxin-antitoxin system Phd/YefM family antitoxin [Ottowia testudinis]QTD45441.1 type II toxin-antitoxin system Phd/YefM family antitoxin [Ottowia testudinis]
MQVVSVTEFRARAAEMVDRVQKGETVRILRHGKPVAELVPPQPEVAEPGRVPAWKRPFEPLHIRRADGKSGAQLIIEERASGW